MPSRKRLDLKEKEKLIEEASKPGFDRKNIKTLKKHAFFQYSI